MRTLDLSFGVSGAWIGNFTALAAYQPYIALITLTALGYGFYSVYWRAPPLCEGEACERPLPRPVVKSGLWLGAMLILSALLVPRFSQCSAAFDQGEGEPNAQIDGAGDSDRAWNGHGVGHRPQSEARSREHGLRSLPVHSA